MTLKELKTRYGARICGAAQAMVDEGAKRRQVHDASNWVRLNHRIKIVDYVAQPGVHDTKAVAEEMEEEFIENGTRWITIVWDFDSAHRVVAVDELSLIHI